MDTTCLITVTFGVPQSAQNELLKVRELLESQYVIKSRLADPHITIYQCKVLQNDIESVIEALQRIASEVGDIELVPTSVNIKNEYVGIKYQKSSSVERVHLKIVEALNKLRGDLVRSTYVEHRGLYSQTEQLYIDKYGYPYVMSEYSPHLALIALEDREDAEKVKIENISRFSFISPVLEVVIISNAGKEIKQLYFKK
ncbi:MAG TPA: DUF1045 domain-containing protein [Candidatus Paceibacterota bacterium]